MNLFGIYPAIVKEYDRARRECRVEIPGFTDGAQELPIAEFLQPLGDRTEDNEIRIKVEDRVFVQFFGGDPRFPLIIGHRAKNVENSIGRRHIEQDNIHTISDQTHLHEAGTTYTVTAGTGVLITAGETMTFEAGSKITLKVGGSTFELTGSGIKQISSANTMQGPLTQSGGDITSDSKSVQHHTHTGNLGNPTSQPN